jgi:hypothetical protein
MKVTWSAFSVGNWAVSIEAIHNIYESTLFKSLILLLPLWSIGPISQFLDHFTDGRTLWTSYQLVARPLPKHMTTQTQNKHIHIPNSHAFCGIRTHDPGFRAKTIQSLDRSATVTGKACLSVLILIGVEVVSVLCKVRCVQIWYCVGGILQQECSLCLLQVYQKRFSEIYFNRSWERNGPYVRRSCVLQKVDGVTVFCSKFTKWLLCKYCAKFLHLCHWHLEVSSVSAL